MSLTCKILASFLLIFAVSTKGEVSENTKVIWGRLDHDINLDIPGFQMNDGIADTRWDKNKIKIAQLKQDKPPYQITDTYVMLKNGTLKIKALKRNDSDVYTVSVYDSNGKNILEKAFDLKIQEVVSKPVISWSCTNRTLICEVAKGSDPKLKLFLNETRIKESHQKVITHKWNSKWTASFNCMASNNVSAQKSTVTISCSGDSAWYMKNQAFVVQESSSPRSVLRGLILDPAPTQRKVWISISSSAFAEEAPSSWSSWRYSFSTLARGKNRGEREMMRSWR
ncbi:T-cell surface antigen CD2 isoform X2 [Balaenoptera acutorostrata]|uniref:T-cell surface antigen CD2 n=1 Tax=Balaenoptera acutorostrata TaxID=9767 RepID=A0A383Z2K9_BALAC|nr:T-cell surface antigen CD2 isoform X2 [Balaenoptera acutorostrata]